MELGFAKASVPNGIKKNTIESQLAPVILNAEAKAKIFRNGIWSDHLPPIPSYIIYWRKGTQLGRDLLLLTLKKLLQGIGFTTKITLIWAKNLALRPFKSSPAPKQIQAS